MGIPRFKNPELILFLMLAMFGLSAAWGAAATAGGVDFYQFWVVGQVLHRSVVTDVYSDNARSRLGAEFFEQAMRTANPHQRVAAEYRQNLKTYSSPFFYSVFELFSTGNYETDLRNYRVLMLACLVFSVAVLCRLLHHSLSTTLGAVAVFSAWFEPFSSDMRVGNVNSIQLAMLAAYLWVAARMRWRHRDIWGGALLGLAVAFKPNLVIVAAVLVVDWLLNGQFRRVWFHATGAAVGRGIAFLVATACFGTPRCWINWLAATQSLLDEIMPVDYGNFAPARILGEAVGADITVPLAVIFGSLAVAGLWLKRPGASSGNGTAPASDTCLLVPVVSLACLLVALMPRLVWLHYYMLTIPSLLVLLCPMRTNSLLRPFLAIPAFLCLALSPIINIGISLTPHLQGALMVFATFILFVLTVFPHRVSPLQRGA